MDGHDEVGQLWKSSGVPGLSLAYSVGEGPVVTRTWGVASVDGPVTADTLFRSGSVTKVVTAYAVLRSAVRRSGSSRRTS
jgi:CubicO group peptidase (beta-lactamase class C family)